MGQIKLVLDNDVLTEYNEYYFSMHPRAKKVPIPRPYHPSINQWMILPRMSMNNLKQAWKQFVCWWIDKQGYSNMKLEHFKITTRVYMGTMRRFDIDNFCCIKFILDGFTESGFIVDDDCKHLYSLVCLGDYDKIHPRTEITVDYEDKE